MRAYISRQTERVMVSSEISPCSTALSRWGNTRPQHRSQPLFTASAAASSAVATSLWFSYTSSMAPQSLTT